MKTFIKWAEDQKLDIALPQFDENTKRSGMSFNYPDAYIRAQYPDLYFAPIAADHAVKLSAKGHAAPAGTPG